jgi:hypothetical protein
LKEPTRSKLQGVIRDYATLRLSIAQKRPTSADIDQSLPRFEKMHSQMVELVQQAISDGTPIAV